MGSGSGTHLDVHRAHNVFIISVNNIMRMMKRMRFISARKITLMRTLKLHQLMLIFSVINVCVDMHVDTDIDNAENQHQLMQL